MEDKKWIAEGIIDDIRHEMAILDKELYKATTMTAPSRRARIITLNLEKLFKRFRKITCELGLK